MNYRVSLFLFLLVDLFYLTFVLVVNATFFNTVVECENQCENCTAEGTNPEMWQQKLMTINDIRSHIISLEQEHKQHRKITHRLTRHGSKWVEPALLQMPNKSCHTCRRCFYNGSCLPLWRAPLCYKMSAINRDLPLWDKVFCFGIFPNCTCGLLLTGRLSLLEDSVYEKCTLAVDVCWWEVPPYVTGLQMGGHPHGRCPLMGEVL